MLGFMKVCFICKLWSLDYQHYDANGLGNSSCLVIYIFSYFFHCGKMYQTLRTERTTLRTFDDYVLQLKDTIQGYE